MRFLSICDVVMWPKHREASMVRSVGESEARSSEPEVLLEAAW